MVSTTFTKETHLEVDLPEAEGDLQPVSKKQIEVIVDSQGGYAVNGKNLVNKQLETLQNALEEVAEGDYAMPFIITGDSDASYQAIISVMDVAGQLGFVNISMTTRSPSTEE